VTIDELRRRRDDITAAARRRGLSDVRVFGSVARGDARTDSDLDVLVNVEPGRSMLDVGAFQEDLRELLGMEVHVVALGTEPGRMGRRALAEAVPL